MDRVAGAPALTEKQSCGPEDPAGEQTESDGPLWISSRACAAPNVTRREAARSEKRESEREREREV